MFYQFKYKGKNMCWRLNILCFCWIWHVGWNCNLLFDPILNKLDINFMWACLSNIVKHYLLDLFFFPHGAIRIKWGINAELGLLKNFSTSQLFMVLAYSLCSWNCVEAFLIFFIFNTHYIWELGVFHSISYMQFGLGYNYLYWILVENFGTDDDDIMHCWFIWSDANLMRRPKRNWQY